MPDLKTHIAALRLTWIKRFKTATLKWKNIANINYPQLEHIQNYNPDYLCQKVKNNSFWEHVLLAYKLLYYKVNQQVQRKSWQNPFIVINRWK